MMRCAQCQGRFGLVRYHWYNVAFCKKICRSKYLDKLALDRDLLKRWFGYLARPISQQR
jgi:hypothetical protein